MSVTPLLVSASAAFIIGSMSWGSSHDLHQSSQLQTSLTSAFNASSPYVDLNSLKIDEIIHTKTGIKITPLQMIDEVNNSDVIYISEQHDNAASHDVQLRILKELYERNPGKVAVGMEMFRQSVQPSLDLIETGQLSLDNFNALFDRQWSASWRAEYQPLLDFIIKKSIPVVGLKPSKQLEAMVRQNIHDSSVPDLDLDDPYHKEHFMPFFQGHSNVQLSDRMYRMMVLWDEAMAENVANYISNYKKDDRKLVVIAGVGHIGYGFGIPRRAYKREPHSYSSVIPKTDGSVNISLPLSIGDYIWRVPYTQRTPTQAPKKPNMQVPNN